jgi:hypothetical protein
MQKTAINSMQVKKTLPYGAIKEIAFRSKMSIYTVSRVIKGGSKNPIVLKNLKEYIEEIQQVNTEINALIQ